MNSEGPILGADTETFNGGVKLLRISGGVLVEPEWTNAGQPDQKPTNYTDACLSALYEAAREARWVVFWNLGFDMSAIIKPWVVEHAEEFRATHYANIKRRQRLAMLGLKEQTDGTLSAAELRERQELTVLLDGEDHIERFDTEKFHVVLIGSKAMSLTPLHGTKGQRTSHGKKKEREWFYDASPWYSSAWGGMSLNKAGLKFLGRGKTDEDLSIDRARIGSEAGYYEAHREDIRQYCLDDCDLTAALMAHTVRGFENLGYPFPDKPFSRASVSREYLKVTGVMDATAAQYQHFKGNSYHDLWEKSFRGGVFLLMGAGRHERPFSIDLNSAYPAAMVKFPSLEGAVVVDYEDPRFESCFFKFYRIRLAPTPRTPMRDRGETRKIYGWWPPKEERSLCVTGVDLEVLAEFGEPYLIEQACGILTPSTERPLAYLGETYQRKSEVKARFGSQTVEYANVKILLNGTYGILAQRKPVESQWTNLIYASYVTAWCRRALWRAVRETEERGDWVVSLATDGLLISGEGSREFWSRQSSDVLGAWAYEPHDEAVCLENGVGFLDASTKKRGLPGLTREALLRCDSTEWMETTHRPLKLRSSLIQKRTESIGVFEEHVRNLCPVKSYRVAGQAFPKDLASAPLRSYFDHTWRLRLRGQVGDRLTPPRDPGLRRAWDAHHGKGLREKGYDYPTEVTFRKPCQGVADRTPKKAAGGSGSPDPIVGGGDEGAASI
jgi:hypothetical protein